MRIIYWPSFHLKNHQQLAIGETKSFIASIDGLPGEKMIYKSENPDIVSIDANGNVTGLKKGRGDITATSIGKVARLTIDVYDKLHEKVKNIAHMGLKSQAPENTIPSFTLAIEAGFDYVEANLQVSKDKELICLYNDNLQGMMGLDYTVDELDYEDIKSKRFISGKKLSKYPDVYVPTLEEFLSLISQSNSCPLIDLKSVEFENDYSLLEKVNDLIIKYELEDRAVVMSLKQDVLNKFKEINPNVQLAFMDNNVNFDDIDYLKQNNLMVFLDFKIAEYNFIEELEANGIKVMLSLINEKDSYDSVKYWPIHSICSSFIFFNDD
jgi:glycerophosphoryl diester phosphodiesterase